MSDTPIVSAPWSIDGVRPPVRSGAPALGEYNEILDKVEAAQSRQSKANKPLTTIDTLDAGHREKRNENAHSKMISDRM